MIMTPEELKVAIGKLSPAEQRALLEAADASPYFASDLIAVLSDLIREREEEYVWWIYRLVNGKPMAVHASSTQQRAEIACQQLLERVYDPAQVTLGICAVPQNELKVEAFIATWLARQGA